MNLGLSRSVVLYYEELARTIPVDPDEERRLIHRWQRSKDYAARDTLLRGHLRFVVTLAKKRTRDPDRLQDMIAAGNLGLIKALDRFDLKRRPPIRFLTYAGWWINKEILDNDYATSSLVHVPTHRQKAQRKKTKEYHQAMLRHGPDAKKTRRLQPSLPEGSTVSLDLLREAIEDRRYFNESDWAGRQITESDVTTLTHVIPETAKADGTVRCAIGLLPPRTQTVLNLYYGIKDDPRNHVQIAALLDMSPERVRQLKIAGIKQLREIMAKHHGVATPDDVY
jgi:RNA polymerase primary sigma factor